jgi:hypothetical protein
MSGRVLVARLFVGASQWAANRFAYRKRSGDCYRVWLSDEEKQEYVEKLKRLEHKNQMRFWSIKRY